MKTIEIVTTERKSLGKKETKKLRKEGNVPCVIYGGEKVTHFYAHKNDFRHLVYTPNVYLVNLKIDGKECRAIMQDIQYHPVTDEILHIDFYEIFVGKEVIIKIPVKLNGLSIGVKEGGKLALETRKLRVKALPKNLPDILNVDVTELKLEKTIKVGDLSFEDLELLDFKNSVVCSVKLTRVAKSLDEETEGEETEGEETEEATTEE